LDGSMCLYDGSGRVGLGEEKVTISAFRCRVH